MDKAKEGGESGTPNPKRFTDLESKTIFADVKVFDTEYVPKEIFVRREFDDVVRFYFDCVKFKLQQCMVVVGPTGSGKTLAARYYGDEATAYAAQKHTDFRVAYVNCREVPSLYSFWQLLLASLDKQISTGFPLLKLVDDFVATIERYHHVVVILDEIEKLPSTLGRGKANDILYLLTRLKSSRGCETAISTILITNHAHVMDFLDAPVRSSLNSRSLVIGNYDAKELAGILSDRVKKGLIPGACSDGTINRIAAEAAQFNSDARFAIRLLSNAAALTQKREGTTIENEDVKAAVEQTNAEIERDLVDRVSPNQLLVLYAISQAAQQTKGSFLSTNSIYQKSYRPMCERAGRKPLVYSQFLSIVSSLQNYDLVSNHLARRRAGGFMRMIEPTFDPRHIQRICEKADLW